MRSGLAGVRTAIPLTVVMLSIAGVRALACVVGVPDLEPTAAARY